jgi:hypothetical protein
MAVDPSTYTTVLGSTFSLNINVTDVVNLTCWQLTLYYVKTVVNCTKLAEGPFLKSGGATYNITSINNNYNYTHGRVQAAFTLEGVTSHVDGSGVILTVTFKAVGSGNTSLTLADTLLGDLAIPPNPIPHADYNGAVTVTVIGHNVAVTAATNSKAGCLPMSTVGRNQNFTVTMTVENDGNYTENNIVLAVYANWSAPPSVLLATRTISLQPLGGRATISLACNTSSLSYGNYTLTAVAGPVQNETYVSDNTMTCGQILVTVPGDIDGDGYVFLADLGAMATAWTSTPGSPNWNPNADITEEGQVFLGSLGVMAQHWTESWS